MGIALMGLDLAYFPSKYAIALKIVYNLYT